MKVYLSIATIAVCLLFQSFLAFSPKQSLIPIFDVPLENRGVGLPRNFRMTTQSVPFASRHLQVYLKASGSGQFSEVNFAEMLKMLPVTPDKVVVVDLREESHGFINGIAVHWNDGLHNYGNVGKTLEEILEDENQRLFSAAKSGKIVLDPKLEAAALVVQTTKNELEIVTKNGCAYHRLPVTDHNRPSDEVVDRFVEMIKSLPQDSWVHFHCKAGKGRTTTFLTLLDIMNNGKTDLLTQIVSRQTFLGGIDLNSYQKLNVERTRAGQERYQFIEQFYSYCREVPEFEISWSDWLNGRSAPLIAAK